MKKIILVYEYFDWADNGGGIHYEEFKTEAELDKRVEEIYKMDKHELITCGILDVFIYREIERVTKIERE